MCGILVPRSGNKHWSLPHTCLQWKLRVPTIGPPGNSPHVTLTGNQSCHPPKLHWWRRQWQPSPVLLPEKSHGQRSLVGCSPWGRQELDTTERLHFHFSLSCTGEGNGTPVFLPGESQGRGSLVGCCLWGRKESDTTEVT